MASVKPYLTEIGFLILNFVWLLFVLTNANTNLGNAYLWFTGGSIFLLFINILIFDKQVTVTLDKGKTTFTEALFQAVIGWVILLAISFAALNFIDPLKANFGSIMAQIHAATPAFSNSVTVNFLTVSLAIGFAETQFWARMLEFLSDRFGITINRSNIRKTGLIILIALLSFLFWIFHLTSKGVTQFSALAIVFIMMAISLFMVAYNDGETKSANLMHIIANGVAAWIAIQAGGLIF